MAQDSVANALGPIFKAMLGDPVPVRVDFWDDSHIGQQDAKGRARVNSVDALRRIVWSPGELGLARAYVAGDIDLHGDIYETVRELTSVQPNFQKLGLKTVLNGVRSLRQLGGIGKRLEVPAEEAQPSGGRHSKHRDKQAISHHYDVGNEFYRLLLGETMTYSCARFIEPTNTLDEAQTNKYDLICRKLGLHEGMRLLDVGCGWGGMALHAAKTYGVKAVGITLSKEQAELARQRVIDAGLNDQIEIRVQDYRDLGNERFDAISSIGMFEHVGRSRMTEYFHMLHSLLTDGGRLLNHAIDSVGGSYMPDTGFVARYVFPDGELQDLSETIGAMQDAHFEVRDIETLREHYAMTLRRWVSNLENNWDEAVRLVGIGRARVWLLYMVGSVVSFETNRISIHQTLATKTTSVGVSNMPLTRAEYA